MTYNTRYQAKQKRRKVFKCTKNKSPINKQNKPQPSNQQKKTILSKKYIPVEEPWFKLVSKRKDYIGRIHRYIGCPKLKGMNDYDAVYVNTRTIEDFKLLCYNCFPTKIFRHKIDFYNNKK